VRQIFGQFLDLPEVVIVIRYSSVLRRIVLRSLRFTNGSGLNPLLLLSVQELRSSRCQLAWLSTLNRTDLGLADISCTVDR
jgi:hypothetical protein